ncbi:MAG: hypothetical protein OXG11_06365 [Chloroflexi bacterium]|nr:hypothetical protein [Chloroflexota bacterium]
MSQEILERAEQFIWKNARLLERQMFAFHFKDGSPDSVVDALRPYQNADGGFGHALEPDIRCPDSQPVPVQHALEILDKVEFDGEMVNAACEYLKSITTSEGGVPWLLPSAHGYPRAPWWNTDVAPPASVNPTAAIAGMLHRNRFQHEWLEGATSFCWSKIAEMELTDPHDMAVALTFLNDVPDRERADAELPRVIDQLFSFGLVADADAEGYVSKPLDWAPTPDHPLRKHFRDDDVAANLDVLVAGQQADGGWNITWEPISPACELEWRGGVTLDALLTLQANGRLNT